MSSMPDVQHTPGDRIGGILVRAVTPLEELRAVACEGEHEATGARLLHLHTDDPENLFSVSFPTPPPDDTGVAHILEHAVLAGSRRFPVREPFFEMIKMSMATFINAMTGQDCTYYPVASNVRRDLFNLAEVYADAVFHPLLTEETFHREGHHLAPADPSAPLGPLTINGIVYSEMRGAYSSPEAKLYRNVTRDLFPDTVYGRDAGGDPDAIPTLTWEDLRRFHAAYYHPSNAYIFCYGNIETAAYAAFVDEQLAGFSRAPGSPEIPAQPRWTAPRRSEDVYPVGAGESLERNTYAAVEWLTGASFDVEHAVLLRLLALLLVGNEAAPLRKAVIDSRLGDDVVFAGDSSVGREATFGLAVKGTDPDKVDAIEELVLRTLRALSATTLAPERVEAAFQQASYQYLEVQPMFPLHMLNRVMSAWVYGVDPLAFMRLGAALKACREKWRRDPRLFNHALRDMLVENPHRLTAVLRPDRELQARTEEDIRERMRQRREALSDDAMRGVAEAAAALDAGNAEPNPPEALATLPQLRLGDLPDGPSHIDTTVEEIGGAELLRNDVFSNKVSYLTLCFDLNGMPAELRPYLHLYMDAVEKMGTAGADYAVTAERIAAFTGGIDAHVDLMTRVDDRARELRTLRVSLKTLDRHAEQALDLVHDLLFALDPHDADRLRDVVTQLRAHERTEMVHNGQRTAALHAARGFAALNAVAEEIYGLPQLRLLERLHGGFETEGGALMARIAAIRDFLSCGRRLTVSFTGTDRVFDVLRRRLAAWLDAIPAATEAADAAGVPAGAPRREGLAGPIDVAHCAAVMPAPHIGDPRTVALALGTHIVGLDYVLPEVRFRGNAYGAGLRHHAFDGTLHLSSFRDPQIRRTLEVFERARDYVAGADWSRTDIERAVIAVAKRDLRPVRPASATNEALARHLIGATRDWRDERFVQLRSLDPATVRDTLRDVLEAGRERTAVCVVAGRDKLEQANRDMPGRPLDVSEILQA